MSLKKLLEIGNTGFSVEHWFLAETRHNHLNKVVELIYIGFKTKQDRLDGKSPVPDAVIKYPARNWSEIVTDAQGNETVHNHNDYNKYITSALKTALKVQARKHVRTVAMQNQLSDAVDD